MCHGHRERRAGRISPPIPPAAISQAYSGAPNAASVAKPLPQQRFTHEAPSAEVGTLSGPYPVTVTKAPIDIAAIARAFSNLGLVNALEYGVASADLKRSIPWVRSGFLERKRLR